jgi:putative membrane protein
VLIRILWRLAANAAALGVAAWLLDGVVVDDWIALLIAAVVFAIVNTIVKPIVTILGIPLIIITLGIAYFFINMGMLWLTDVIAGDGFDIEGFWTYVGATILVWIVNFALDRLLPSERVAQAF